MSPMREHRSGTDRARSFDDAPSRHGAPDEILMERIAAGLLIERVRETTEERCG